MYMPFVPFFLVHSTRTKFLRANIVSLN
uniref:Uncharacterized protein n=1 Tax=Arundo donax TaxID=35708 RepID=A0A0A9BSK2_ARUDO